MRVSVRKTGDHGKGATRLYRYTAIHQKEVSVMAVVEVVVVMVMVVVVDRARCREDSGIRGSINSRCDGGSNY